MRKLILMGLSLVVLGFAATAWQLWEARARNDRLETRLSSIEATLAAGKKSSTTLATVLGERFKGIDERIRRVEDSAFDFSGPDPVGRSLEDRISDLESDLGDVQDGWPPAGSFAQGSADVSLLQSEVDRLDRRVDTICGALQSASDNVLFC